MLSPGDRQPKASEAGADHAKAMRASCFLDKNEMPMVALHWEHYFKHILNQCNTHL